MGYVRRMTLLSLGLAALVVFSVTAGGGGLEPSAPPGSTMHSLDELYSLISSLSGGSGQLAGPAAGAMERTNGYMDLNDGEIPGESEDPDHEDWVDLLAVFYTARQPAVTSQSSVGGRLGRRAEFSDLTVVKEMDAATPKLHLYCVKGEHIPKVEIEFTMKLSGGRVVYHKITLAEVRVSGFSPLMTHTTGDKFIHIEAVTLRYGQIKWDYTTYDAQGSPTGTISTGWSLVENKEAD